MAIDFERQKFFWSRVEKRGDHLIWTGAATTRGYGKIEINGRSEYAHRVAWCIAKNSDLVDIDDCVVLRTCEENECVEPEHLLCKKKRNTKK